jgi:hypothetical protein
MNAVRYLADEDFRQPIVKAIRRLEPSIEVTSARELGLSGYTDGDVLTFAQQNNWIVLSHDVNTLKSTADDRVLKQLGVAGVILVAQSKPTRIVAEALVQIWATTTMEDWRDVIVFVPF